MNRLSLCVGLSLFTACEPKVEPRLPSVQTQFPSLQEAAAQGRLTAIEDNGLLSFHLKNSRVSFSPTHDSLTLHSDGLEARLALTEIGRGHMTPVEPVGDVQITGPRVVLPRGPVFEWYLHTAEGLEQGFSLTERLPGRGPLRIAMNLQGDLRAKGSGDAVRLIDADGVLRYRYDHLMVEDADGVALEAELASRCVPDACTIELIVQDEHAAYPLYVDPLLAENAVDVDIAAATNNLGTAVALQGDWAVIGAPDGTLGKVFVVERNVGNPDNWGLEHTISSSLDGFGNTLSLDFPYLAVGAPESDSVVVYEYRNGTWTELQTLVGSAPGSRFGEGLHLQTPYLAVGAPDTGIGEVAIHLLTNGTFAALPLPPVSLPSSVAGDRIGAQVALRFPLLVVGAPGYAGGDGAVTVVEASTGIVRENLYGDSGTDEAYGSTFDVTSSGLAVGTGTRVETFTFEPQGVGDYDVIPGPVILPPPTAGANFGGAVALLDDTMVVGDAGTPARAHVFARGALTWFHSQSLDAAPANGTTPTAVALTSRTILAGTADQGGVGGARLWNREATSFIETTTLTTAQPTVRAGKAVAIQGRFAVVGDPLAPTTAGGRVDSYQQLASLWFYHAGIAAPIGGPASEFGAAVDIDGDVLVVGSPASGGTGAFNAYTWSGSNWSTDGKIYGATIGARFGESVAIDGQLIAVGAPGTAPGAAHMFVVNGDLSVSSTGVQATGSTVGQGLGAAVQYGRSVAIQGDLVAIGARGWDTATHDDAGAVEVLQFVVGSPSMTSLAFLEGIDADDRCGTDVFLAADRLAVGCENNGTVPGKALIYRGDLDDYDLEARIDGQTVADQFGASVALFEDRLLVGARGGSRVDVFRRNAGGEDLWGSDTALDLSGPPSTLFGEAIDVDGTRVIVGASGDGTGTARVYQLNAIMPRYATADSALVNEDGSVDLVFTANDWDGNGNTITDANANATLVTLPSDGVVTVSGQTFTYEPDENFYGTDTFSYALSGSNTAPVTVVVASVNDLPVALPDSYDAIEEVQLNATSVLTNDTDIEPGTLSAVLVTSPAHALTFSLSPDGTFNYRAVDNYAGSDSFTYLARDSDGGDSSPVTVTITVEDTPEAPILSDSVWSTPANTPLLVDAPGLASTEHAQLPGAGTTFFLDNAGSLQGTVSVLANGAFSFAPAPAFTGTTSFTVGADYQGAIDTALVTIDVGVGTSSLPVPTADTYTVREDETLVVGSLGGVLANDTDPDGDALSATFAPATVGQFTGTGANGSFEWVPPADFTGTALLEYTLTGGLDSVPGVAITVQVTAVNDAPMAVPDSYSFSGPGPHEVPAIDGVLLNDGDVDGDGLAALLIRSPGSGTLDLDTDGGFAFTPRVGFEGAQTAEYVVTDGVATSFKAVIELNVTDNAPPEGHTGDTAAGTSDTAECVDAFFPDQDGDGFASETATPRIACSAPEGFTAALGDCDDTRADIYPGAPETQADGIDQDCDGSDADVKPAGSCSTAPQGVWLILLLPLMAGRRARPC